MPFPRERGKCNNPVSSSPLVPSGYSVPYYSTKQQALSRGQLCLHPHSPPPLAGRVCSGRCFVALQDEINPDTGLAFLQPVEQVLGRSLRV